jgi:hypothetical protein
MKIIVTKKQLSKLNTPNKLTVKIKESQLNKIKLHENTELYPLVSDIDDNTVEVKLIDFENKNILKITPQTNDPSEPNLKDLIGKKRGDILNITKDGETKDYTITTIVNRVTKNTHQNFDEISSIEELIIKLKSDPYFQNSKYAPKKQTYSVLEKLKNKGEGYNRRIMQIFYLLFRRSGSIKKFETKLNRFIPFMKLLLSKGDQFFDCMTNQLELALENADENQLSAFASNKSNYENLIIHIKNTKNCNDETSIKLETIFKTQDFVKYERQFIGNHFKHAPTSMSMNLTMSNLSNFDSETFNQSTNLIKMQMMLSWILSNYKKSEYKTPINNITNFLVDKLNISFPNQIKRDLLVVEDVYGSNENTKNTSLLTVGDSVEVKYKDYSSPDFLCEFFKPESHNSTMEYLVNSLIKVDGNLNSSQEVNKLIGVLDSAIVNKIKNSNLNDEVINLIKTTTAGIIFKDFKFVKMSDIDLMWTDIGYAKKPRIAIQYTVKDTAKIYTLNIDSADKQQLSKIYWAE